MLGQNRPDRQVKSDAGGVPNPTAEARGSLLIIEDAPIHSTIIAHIADRTGFATTIASCYEEACDLLQTRQFDCITLDLGLGAHVGAEVLNQLAKLRCMARIVIISGSERAICDETMQIGRSLGLNICEPVPKPIDLKALREMLEHIRTRSRLEKLAARVI